MIKHPSYRPLYLIFLATLLSSCQRSNVGAWENSSDNIELIITDHYFYAGDHYYKILSNNNGILELCSIYCHDTVLFRYMVHDDKLTLTYDRELHSPDSLFTEIGRHLPMTLTRTAKALEDFDKKEVKMDSSRLKGLWLEKGYNIVFDFDSILKNKVYEFENDSNPYSAGYLPCEIDRNNIFLANKPCNKDLDVNVTRYTVLQVDDSTMSCVTDWVKDTARFTKWHPTKKQARNIEHRIEIAEDFWKTDLLMPDSLLRKLLVK